MSISEVTHASDLASRCQKLRFELKQWEASFAAANDGRKAERDDIKANPEIAQKSKEYAKLRNRRSITSAQSSSPPPAAKKRNLKSTSKVQKSHEASPLSHPISLDPYDSPRSVPVTPLALRTFIGPTPQKNGKVLGLFDLLSAKKPTPSKGSFLNVPIQDVQATPSKLRSNPSNAVNDISETPNQHSRTPQSSSKRKYLDSFLTPTARRVRPQQTPSSRRLGIAKLKYDETPEFLRRDSQHAAFPLETKNQAVGLGDEDISWSPIAVRMPKKPAGRGLSALVQGLRGMEEEELDEDLELLREMEADEAGIPYVRKMQSPKPPKLLVEDSQIEMPLGADGAGEVSSDENMKAEGRGRDGRLLKIYKKKGQKRTTRKVTMKPNAAKWKPEQEWKGAVESGGEDREGVEDTQIVAETLQGENGGNEVAGGSEAGDEVVGLEGEKKRKKKPPKKISATANPNFRTLNIKNKQSKGKRGGRFGKRR